MDKDDLAEVQLSIVLTKERDTRVKIETTGEPCCEAHVMKLFLDAIAELGHLYQDMFGIGRTQQDLPHNPFDDDSFTGGKK